MPVGELYVLFRPQLLVAEPERYLGKVTYNKLVFPRYGKPGKPLSPGPQQVEPELWAELLRKAEANESPAG